MNILKRYIAVVLSVMLLPVCAYASKTSFRIQPETILGSWYGQYVGYDRHNGKETDVWRYMDMRVDKADEYGNFSGKAYVTTVKGQGHNSEWYNYNFKGTLDLASGEFHMMGTNIFAKSGGKNYELRPLDGVMTIRQNGEATVAGVVGMVATRTFNFARVSDWAREDITEANALGLIPDTIKEKDLSKPITRAEFASVAANLYGVLTNTKPSFSTSPFTDIAGNPNEAAIKAAYGLNISMGITDTEFEPDMLINREQIATMLCRTIKKYKFRDWTYADDYKYQLDYMGVTPFSDDDEISPFAKSSVYYMAKMGIINGVTKTLFAPKRLSDKQDVIDYATATREQAIVLSLRIYKHADELK